MLRVLVDNRVRVFGLARPELVAEIRAAFEYENPDYWKAKRFGFKKPTPMRLSTSIGIGSEMAPKELSVPRGAFARLSKMLRDAGEAFEIEDGRELGPTVSIPPHLGELWPFQEKIESEAILHQTALVRSATGSGKTTAALAIIAKLGLPALVIVWNAGLLRQWVDRCVKELGVRKSWVGVIQGAKRRIGPITIGMMQTLDNMGDELANEFGVVVCDEVHRAAGETLYRVVDRFPAKYRIGVSDSEKRRDRKEFLIHDLFGPPVVDVKYKTLVEEGYVLDVEVCVIPTGFSAPWYRELKEKLEQAEQAARGKRTKLVMTLRRQQLEAFGRLVDQMSVDEERNALIVDEVAAAVAHGQEVLAMSHRIEHVREIDRLLVMRGIRSGFVIGGEEYRVEYERTLARMKAGELKAAVGTYHAVGTGIDLPSLSVGVFATPVANSKDAEMQFRQFRGRFCRVAEGKKPYIVYPWDLVIYGVEPLRNLCRWARHVSVLWRGEWCPGKKVLKEFG